MEELKACPFCGGKAVTGGYEAYSDDSSFGAIECSVCGVWGKPFIGRGGEEKSITHWNTRASGWISVEDGIPSKMFDWYLISSSCNAPHETVVTMAFLDSDEEGNPLWLAQNDYERLGNREEWEGVTHWMPLPAAPEVN